MSRREPRERSAQNLRDALHHLRTCIDRTIGGLDHDGALELSHLAVACRRVLEQILPTPRKGER